MQQLWQKYGPKSELVRHQRIHTREKSFHWSHSDKNFLLWSILVSHQRIHTADKDLQFSHGGKNFSQKTNIANHQRTPTGERPYQCSHCGKSFSQISVLVSIQRIHSGEIISMKLLYQKFYRKQLSCGTEITHWRQPISVYSLW